MDTVYSLTLLLALLTGGVSAAALLVVAWLGGRSPARRLEPAGVLSAVVSLCLGVISAWVHLRFGHGPQTPEPMRLMSFVGFHKAYWVVLALSLGSIVGWASTRRSRRGT